MNYESMSCSDLRKECQRRLIKGVSKSSKKDLIFTLKCNDTFGFKISLKNPGCTWERMIELDPLVLHIKSVENLLNHLKGIETTTNKISVSRLQSINNNNNHKKLFIYDGRAIFSPLLDELDDISEPVRTTHNDKEKFQIALDREYENLNIGDITLEKLIHLGNAYTPIMKDRFAFDYEKLHQVVPYLEELDSYIGWDAVKQKIVSILIPILLHLDAEKSMTHTVIMGPPGVGKTTLGIILSKIYGVCGLIENPKGSFKVFRKSDLIGEFLGQTAIKTQKAIDSSLGGVMFIDEAYSLGVSNPDGNGASYAKECIDTINQNLTENAGKFICIIAGYEDLLKKQFFSINYGLERRFPISFRIDKYSADDLTKILFKKVLEEQYEITSSHKEIDAFVTKHYKEFSFYAGDIENLIQFVKRRHALAIFGKGPALRKKLTLENFDQGFLDFVENKSKKEQEEEPPRALLSMYI